METGSWTSESEAGTREPLPPASGYRIERVYPEVRGLSRGLAVLRALNRAPGGLASTTTVAQACGIHRTTAKRLLETLRLEGLVRQAERDGHYRLTFAVRRLSEGFEDEAWIQHVASPMMHAAVGQLMWPCDLCTLDGGFMVVRESTHRWSMLSQHRAMVGARLPIMTTAVGRAYFAACSIEERRAILELLALRKDEVGELARDRPYMGRVVRETRRRGHAINNGEMAGEAEFAAVAVPVHAAGHLAAAINVIFPVGACTTQEAAKRFVPPLKRLAQSIGKASAEYFS